MGYLVAVRLEECLARHETVMLSCTSYTSKINFDEDNKLVCHFRSCLSHFVLLFIGMLEIYCQYL